MRYPIEIPANSFIETYETNEYDEIDPPTIVEVGWKNIDTGEVVSIEYRNDICQLTERILFYIMGQQIDAQNLGPEACGERLCEIAAARI